jgi:hypothetical protein
LALSNGLSVCRAGRRTMHLFGTVQTVAVRISCRGGAVVVPLAVAILALSAVGCRVGCVGWALEASTQGWLSLPYSGTCQSDRR